MVAAGEAENSEPVFSCWVDPVMDKLARLGINEVDDLRSHLEPDPDSINHELAELGEKAFKQETLALLVEACDPNLPQHTGHIVFANGPAEWRPYPEVNASSFDHFDHIPKCIT